MQNLSWNDYQNNNIQTNSHNSYYCQAANYNYVQNNNVPNIGPNTNLMFDNSNFEKFIESLKEIGLINN